MNLKNRFRKYLKPKNFMKIVNVLLILAMLLTSLPMATQAAVPNRLTQDTLCAMTTDPSGPDNKLYLPVITNGPSGLWAAMTQSVFGSQAPLQSTREFNYEVGKTYTYDYAVDVTSKSFQKTAAGTDETGSNMTVINMKAAVTIDSKNDDGSFSGTIVLNDPFLCTNDGTTETFGGGEEFTAELQKPLKFTQATNGNITSVQIPESSNVTAANMQKGVINALQMTLQAEDTYTVEEAGGQGKYNVDYELSEADGNLAIKKSYNQDSFTEQNRQGDETNAFTLDTSLSATLDSSQGILTSVNGTEMIETGDGIEDADGSNTGFSGATAWTTIATNSKLTFVSVSEASSAIRAAALNLVYQEDGLGANLDEESESPMQAEIDEENIDLDAEVQALVDAPDDMLIFIRILDLIALDPGTDVLDTIEIKLSENSDNDIVTTVLIDLLVETGTPYAQDILNGILGNDTVHAAGLSATMSITTEEHALIGLVLIDSPTMTTVNTVKDLSGQEGDDLKDTAVSVLGAAIDKLAENGDAEMSASLTADLVASLGDAGSEEELELYIGALGNASQPDAIDDIAKYITGTLTLANGTEITETTGIRFAALSAAANIPGQGAEDLLVAALSDEDELLGFRLTAFDALSGRSASLSEEGAAALNANTALGSIGTDGEGSTPDEEGVMAAGINATDAVFSRSWNKRFGNGRLGLEVPGVFTVKTPNDYNGLYLYAQQKADGLVWNRRINLVDGRVQFWRNSSTTYKFGAYLDLLNYRIRKKYEQQFNCAWSRNANLWKGSQSKSFGYRIPILAIISINIDISLGVSASLDYQLRANICNPAAMSGYAAILPSGHASASASASLSLWLVRGGVGVPSLRIYKDSAVEFLPLQIAKVSLVGDSLGNVSGQGTWRLLARRDRISFADCH